MGKVYLLAGLFDSESIFNLVLPIPWEKSRLRSVVSNLVDLDGLSRIVLARSKNRRQWGFREFRDSLGDIGIRAWLITADKLHCEYCNDYLLPDVEPTASYVWPSEEAYDENGMKELEALLLSRLENFR